MVEKGKMEVAEKDAINARIKDTMAYEDCKDADLVIEVVAEDMATKNEIFKTLDAICKPEAILATNTSSFYHGNRCRNQPSGESDRNALL